MGDLGMTLSSAFSNLNNSSYESSYSNTDVRSRNMMIPIDKDNFEVPMFALHAFDDASMRNDLDAIVARLCSVGYGSGYKSLDASIRSTLGSSYHNGKLKSLPIVGDPARRYYATHGAIFDSDLNPVMMQTWEIKREYKDDSREDYKYRFIRPLVRVAPNIFIYKNDSLQRYIVNKIVPMALSLYSVYPPRLYNNVHFERTDFHNDYKAKVVIDKCPFGILDTDVPSISTTNEELLKVALDNLEEVLQ